MKLVFKFVLNDKTNFGRMSMDKFANVRIIELVEQSFGRMGNFVALKIVIPY